VVLHRLLASPPHRIHLLAYWLQSHRLWLLFRHRLVSLLLLREASNLRRGLTDASRVLE